MTSATLAELPTAPSGKVGWPWTGAIPQLPPVRSDGSSWPRISIVTPSYNQGQFIEETIRSVLLQGYPNVEYIIIDGGSTDQSTEIIKKYEPLLTHWVTEEDRGQAHAINKGLARSTGEIFQWINSDDVLLPGALRLIAEGYEGEAVATPILCGSSLESAVPQPNTGLSALTMFRGMVFSQPGVWMPRRNVRDLQLDERFQYAFDWHFLLRFLEKGNPIKYLSQPSVFFRYHAASKTISQRESFRKEGHAILAELAHIFTNPTVRSACIRELRRCNWHRRLNDWSNRSNPGDRMAARMILLALRRPAIRVSRHWLGAVRRIIARRIRERLANLLRHAVA